MFNGTVLEQVKHAKFLGVYIDEHLSWDKHIHEELPVKSHVMLEYLGN